MVNGGETRHGHMFRYGSHYAGAGANGYTVADGDMTRYAGIRADTHMAADMRAACYPRLAGDSTMLTYLNIVPDLNQIVNLCPCADACGSKGRTINRGIASYFNIVPHDNYSCLRNFVPASAKFGKAEAIAADARAGMNNAPCAYLGFLTDHHIRVKNRIRADTASRANIHTGIKNSAISNDSAGFNADTGTYSNAFAELNSFRNKGAGMNARRRMEGGGGKMVQYP